MHRVGVEDRVGSEQRQLLGIGLRYEHPIEKITVRWRQIRERKCVGRCDVQGLNTKEPNSIRQPSNRRAGEVKPPERVFDDDLPNASGRKEQRVGPVLQESKAPAIQAPGSAYRTQEHICVEEKFHYRGFLRLTGCPKKPARMSGGNGASKSSAIRRRPLSMPSGRRPRGCEKGMRRATGTPRFETTISSPAATRCKSLESFVLAS